MHILTRIHRLVQRIERRKRDRDAYAVRFRCWGCGRLYVSDAYNYNGRLLCGPRCDGVMQRLGREAQS